MAEYTKEEIRRIEEKWQARWRKTKVYETQMDPVRPKFYALDMFPYPSGAGLHVGHPLGYIATDIVSRFKRIKGFNVLHPMGFDAFGLPAEQYAIEHGVHPADSTAKNIETFKSQLGKIGFCFDWSREVQTCDPKYYKWTQWIFLQIFDSWFNRQKEKAERISDLTKIFEAEGNANHPFPNSPNGVLRTKFDPDSNRDQNFTSTDWKSYPEKKKQEILMEYRLAYLALADVNWCEALGTVLANDEVINGVSYRGGYPVVKRQMRQWSLRITEYAERLLKGLDEIDFSESMKEIQRNWIGRSVGTKIVFRFSPNPSPMERGFETAEKGLWGILKELGRDHRKNPTPEEALVWEYVRNRKLGYKIRRQHSIGSFIADFVCLEKKTVIEIDGEYHNANKEYDEARTKFLNAEGFEVIRFTNKDVNHDLQGVLQKVKHALDSSPSVTPSPREKGTGDEATISVFTTRPDTIFGVDFIVLAPEHGLVKQITTTTQQKEVDEYLKYVESRSEVERMAEVKKITGCFTGAYVEHPFTGNKIPIWISEYVLAGYGTGAIMGVPCGDERDHKFAKHFNIPITNIIGTHYNGEEANPTDEAKLENSDFLNGLVMRDAIDVVVNKLEETGMGQRQVNYKMRDAGWSRQRYWGEPFPVEFVDDIPYAMNEEDLPLELPDTDNFKPSGTGEGPLANLKDWIVIKPGVWKNIVNQLTKFFGFKRFSGHRRDSNTMPTHAGAAWYFLRYMDPHNHKEFASREALNYWNQVDVYIGGSEHAVAHLLYARLWIKVLHDLGYLSFDEPFKKLINQGKITGDSRFVYRVNGTNLFVSKVWYEKLYKLDYYEDGNQLTQYAEEINAIIGRGLFGGGGSVTTYNSDSDENSHYGLNFLSALRVDINIVNGLELDLEAFKKWKPDFATAEFILEDGKYICGSAIEKMSKSYFNPVSPDDIIDSYGADTLRMYEMFLGPLEQSKPWNTNGIDGVFKFLRKYWNLFHDGQGAFKVSDEAPTKDEMKVLHKTIKKVEYDIENFSFNTSVSEFMICVNELGAMKCNKRAILEPLTIVLSPYAPHITEEIWELLGHKDSIIHSSYPQYDESYLTEKSFEYPISVNGKVRAKMNFALDMPKSDIEKLVLASEIIQKWTEGKPPKKVIIVPGKIVNVVL